MEINTRNLSNPALFIQNYIKVTDRKGQLVNFTLNPQQMRLLAEMSKFNIVLKSRQLGVTTLSCAYSIWLAIRYPNTSCLLVSYSMDGANGIFEKLNRLYNSVPVELSPAIVKNNQNELRLENGSRILVVSYNEKKKYICGNTWRFAHVSEAAFYDMGGSEQILEIEKCLAPNGQIIVESTANGANFFSDMYLKAMRRESMYKPFFFGWVDDKLMFRDEYERCAKKYIDLHGKLPVFDELDDAERSLYYRGASVEQLMWRRDKISNSSGGQFAQEFPSTPSEAFGSN